LRRLFHINTLAFFSFLSTPDLNPYVISNFLPSQQKIIEF
jgi:hypothetical protein